MLWYSAQYRDWDVTNGSVAQEVGLIPCLCTAHQPHGPAPLIPLCIVVGALSDISMEGNLPPTSMLGSLPSAAHACSFSATALPRAPIPCLGHRPWRLTGCPLVRLLRRTTSSCLAAAAGARAGRSTCRTSGAWPPSSSRRAPPAWCAPNLKCPWGKRPTSVHVLPSNVAATPQLARQ